MHAQVTRMMRKAEVLKARGRGNAAHYVDIKQGLMTAPVRIGSQSVAWPEHEVEAINRARMAGKSDDEIRTLVASLHAARTVDA